MAKLHVPTEIYSLLGIRVGFLFSVFPISQEEEEFLAIQQVVCVAALFPQCP